MSLSADQREAIAQHDKEGNVTSEDWKITKHCPMCSAVPGVPCTIISGDPELGEKLGDPRQVPHYARFNDHPIPVAIKDEP